MALFNNDRPRNFKKASIITVAVLIAFVIFNFVFYGNPFPTGIEKYSWTLHTARQSKTQLVVAHHPDYDLSANPRVLFANSKPVALTCEAKGGALTITDKTNGKTYTGTYEVNLLGGNSRRRCKMAIDGKEGTMQLTDTNFFHPMMLMIIDGYQIYFST